MVDFLVKVAASLVWVTCIFVVGLVVFSIWIVAPEAILLVLGLLALSVLVAVGWTIVEKIEDEILYKQHIKAWTKRKVNIEKKVEETTDENPM